MPYCNDKVFVMLCPYCDQEMKKGAISGDGRAGRCLQRFLKQQTLSRHVLTIPAKIGVDSFNKLYYNHNRYKGRSVYSPSGSLTGSVSVKKQRGLEEWRTA